MSTTPHAMMPEATHDEAARFAHVVGLKNFLMRQLEPKWRTLVDEKLAPQLATEGRDAKDEYRALERSLARLGAYRTWQQLTVSAQEEMWRSVGECVDRQLPELERRASDATVAGSVRTDPQFRPPRYLSTVDIHLMPAVMPTTAARVTFVKELYLIKLRRSTTWVVTAANSTMFAGTHWCSIISIDSRGRHRNASSIWAVP